MGIAMTLKQYLDAHGVRYETMTHDKTSYSLLTAQASHMHVTRVGKSGCVC